MAAVLLLLLAASVTQWIRVAEGFGRGAPPEACESLSPDPGSHGAPPQSSQAPYAVVFDSLLENDSGNYVYTPGQSYSCMSSLPGVEIQDDCIV